MRLSHWLITNNKVTPFLYPLISLILGIYWQNKFTSTYILLFFFIVLLVFFLCFYTHKNNNLACQFIIAFMFFFSGAFLLQAQRNSNFSLLENLKNKRINILAKVLEKEKEILVKNKTREILKLSAKELNFYNSDFFQKTNFNLLCYTNTPTNTKIGDYILVKDIKLPIHKKNAYLNKNSNFQDYLIKESILFSFFAKKLNYKIISQSTFSLKNWIIKKRDLIYSNLKNKIPPVYFSFFSSIFLGNKKNLYLTEIKNKFNYWGISHYLARSGLHIVLFIFIWTLLLGLIPVNIYIKRSILLLICAIYNIFSWTSISFIRALYVFLIHQIGKIFDQQVSFLHILSALTIIILLFNPIQLFFLDFQLSFALTFSLAWPLKLVDK